VGEDVYQGNCDNCGITFKVFESRKTKPFEYEGEWFCSIECCGKRMKEKVGRGGGVASKTFPPEDSSPVRFPADS
jgi:hypothetical protein